MAFRYAEDMTLNSVLDLNIKPFLGVECIKISVVLQLLKLTDLSYLEVQTIVFNAMKRCVKLGYNHNEHFCHSFEYLFTAYGLSNFLYCLPNKDDEIMYAAHFFDEVREDPDQLFELTTNAPCEHFLFKGDTVKIFRTTDGNSLYRYKIGVVVTHSINGVKVLCDNKQILCNRDDVALIERNK